MATTNTNSTSSFSTFCLKGLLEKDKLTGLNFIDWLRNLRIVLRMEGKIRAIEEPLPDEPHTRATQAIRDEYEKRRTESNEVACLMLATMAPELQKGLETLGSYNMLTQLKDMFQVQAKQERFDTVKALVCCKMTPGSSVSVHVLKMKGYIDQLERLGFPISQELATDFILNSLTSAFDSFVLNYNMNDMEKTIMELHGMLKTAESGMAKAKPATSAVLTIKEGGIQKKKKIGPKGKGKAIVGTPNAQPQPKGIASTSSQKIPQAKDPKEAKCFHCGEIGHWRRACPIYLKDLKDLRAKGVAGSSSMFMIELKPL